MFGISVANNPNSWMKDYGDKYNSQANQFMDPNSAFYKNAADGYNKDIQRNVASATPTMNSLLGMSKANGMSGSGSALMANNQMKAINTKNRDTVSTATSRFKTGLLGMGMDQASNLRNNAGNMYQGYGQGEMWKSETNASFMDNIFSGLGGMLGNQIGKTDWLSKIF
ncbi:MAG: hypothetical protein KKA84_12165 [Bacteroidetes bacterium]|nr:hypothetical protein [Bacteroidota bacterium]